MYIPFVYVEKDKPQINELYQNIVPEFAVRWEELGLALGLEKRKLNIVSSDNKYNPHRAVECCQNMLACWLEVDPSATWSRLEEAITQLHYSIGSNGDYHIYIKSCYIASYLAVIL